MLTKELTEVENIKFSLVVCLFAYGGSCCCWIIWWQICHFWQLCLAYKVCLEILVPMGSSFRIRVVVNCCKPAVYCCLETMVETTIYKQPPIHWGIYSEGMCEGITHTCTLYLDGNCLGVNSDANLPNLLLKPGSCTVNISLEHFDPRLMLKTSTDFNP